MRNNSPGLSSGPHRSTHVCMNTSQTNRSCGWRGGSAGGAFAALALLLPPHPASCNLSLQLQGLTSSSGPFPHPHMHVEIALHMSTPRAAASQPEGDSKPSSLRTSCHRYMIRLGGVLNGKSPWFLGLQRVRKVTSLH